MFLSNWWWMVVTGGGYINLLIYNTTFSEKRPPNFWPSKCDRYGLCNS